MELIVIGFLNLDEFYDLLNEYYGEDGENALQEKIEYGDIQLITLGVQETYLSVDDAYSFLYELDGEDGENYLQRALMDEEEYIDAELESIEF